VRVKNDGAWIDALLLEESEGDCTLMLDTGRSMTAKADQIYPAFTKSQILEISPLLGTTRSDVERQIKRLSFLTTDNASVSRLAATSEFAAMLSERAFPVTQGELVIGLDPQPAHLVAPRFDLRRDLAEPSISFDRVDVTKRGPNVLSGLTRFGAYETPVQPLNVALVTTEARETGMMNLADRLNNGSAQYRGAEHTFGGRFILTERIVSRDLSDYEAAIRAFVQSLESQKVDVALVYLPKGADESNPEHPYFKMKGLLLSEGIVSQMVDDRTVNSPDWRDLNLALNIYAKAGYAPWVLDDELAGVDLFIGLSTSTVGQGNHADRIMAYANVFDSFGRWKFYRGDAIAFPFRERLRYFDRIVKDSVAAYNAHNGRAIKSIHFHLTHPPSREVRTVLSQAVRSVAAGAQVTLVWINAHHGLRIYDLSGGSGGQVARATYLRQQSGEIYLATTGRNTFNQRGMGTPVPLQIKVWSEQWKSDQELTQIAQQILSLTRLNWSSTRSFCHEPITTKYAGDIAKLMAVLGRDPAFQVNPRLRSMPWFL
jgi:hypothetical protein